MRRKKAIIKHIDVQLQQQFVRYYQDLVYRHQQPYYKIFVI